MYLTERVRTPSVTLNAFGCGGFRFQTIAQFWGRPKSGKSTFSYQSVRYFLDDFGDRARVLILDSELSFDWVRMSTVFNINPGLRLTVNPVTKKKFELITDELDGDPRVTLAPAMIMEEVGSLAVNQMKKAHEQGAFLFIVWDSLFGSKPKADAEELNRAQETGEAVNPNAGGMMLRPRILGHVLGDILTGLWRYPRTFVGVVNHARAKIDKYGNFSEYSTGGYAKDHDLHYSVQFSYEEKDAENLNSDDSKQLKKESEDLFNVGTVTKLTVDKAKFMPSFKNVQHYIDDERGGLYVPGRELFEVFKKLKLITASGATWKFSDFFTDEDLGDLRRNYFRKDIYTNGPLLGVMKSKLEEYIRGRYRNVETEYQLLMAATAKNQGG